MSAFIFYDTRPKIVSLEDNGEARRQLALGARQGHKLVKPRCI